MSFSASLTRPPETSLSQKTSQDLAAIGGSESTMTGKDNATEPTTEPGNGIMSKKKQKKQSKSRAERAGLTFPVSKINRHLRESKKSKRVAATAPVYLSAVLEYAASEIIELSGNQLSGTKRKRIKPMDVMRAIRNDDELHKLVGGCAVFVGDRVKDVSAAVVFKPKATALMAE